MKKYKAKKWFINSNGFVGMSFINNSTYRVTDNKGEDKMLIFIRNEDNPDEKIKTIIEALNK